MRRQRHVFGAAWEDDVTTTSGIGNSNALCPQSSTMLNAVSDYVSSRRPVLTKIATYTGGGYIAVKFLAERMRDMRIFLLQGDMARDKYVALAVFI